jgi:CTP synthase
MPGHPWYVAVQFHPEFKSKPTQPHPLFAAFVGAAYQHKSEHGLVGQMGQVGQMGRVRQLG